MCEIAREYDVENASDPEYIFDLRDNNALADKHIYIWGRDGWRKGYYHGYVWVEKIDDTERFRAFVARKRIEGAMPLLQLKDLITATFQKCIPEED